jgi:hypothetical protein
LSAIQDIEKSSKKHSGILNNQTVGDSATVFLTTSAPAVFTLAVKRFNWQSVQVNTNDGF